MSDLCIRKVHLNLRIRDRVRVFFRAFHSQLENLSPIQFNIDQQQTIVEREKMSREFPDAQCIIGRKCGSSKIVYWDNLHLFVQRKLFLIDAFANECVCVKEQRISLIHACVAINGLF